MMVSLQPGGGGEGENTGYWRRYFLVEIKVGPLLYLVNQHLFWEGVQERAGGCRG